MCSSTGWFTAESLLVLVFRHACSLYGSDSDENIAFVIGFLMANEKISLSEAKALVKKKNPSRYHLTEELGDALVALEFRSVTRKPSHWRWILCRNAEAHLMHPA